MSILSTLDLFLCSHSHSTLDFSLCSLKASNICSSICSPRFNSTSPSIRLLLGRRTTCSHFPSFPDAHCSIPLCLLQFANSGPIRHYVHSHSYTPSCCISCLLSTMTELQLRSTAVYCAEMWTFQKVGQQYLESFKMWCWRRMLKISWTDHVKNEEV